MRTGTSYSSPRHVFPTRYYTPEKGGSIMAAATLNEADRAVEIVRELAERRHPNMTPRERGNLLLLLSTERGRAAARAQLIREYGYVSDFPLAFVRAVIARERYGRVELCASHSA